MIFIDETKKFLQYSFFFVTLISLPNFNISSSSPLHLYFLFDEYNESRHIKGASKVIHQTK